MHRFTLSLFSALVLVGVCTSCGGSSDESATAGSADGEDTTTTADAAAQTTTDDTSTDSTDAGAESELGVSVDGNQLSVTEFQDHVDSWARLAEAQGQTVRVADGTLGVDFVGSITEQYLVFESFMAQLRNEGVVISDEDRAAAETAALDSLGETTEPARDLAVEWLAGLKALEPTDQEIDDYVAANAEELSTGLICSSHILVATIEEAEAVQSRLDAGEDFATLAQEVSIDPGSGSVGGDLGCVGPGTFVTPFEDAALAAEPGAVTDPVESDFGFHLIVTRAAEPADLRTLAASALEAEMSARLDAALGSVPVELAPQFGTWDEATKTYTPPTA